MTPAPTGVRTLLPGLHLLETEVTDFDVRAALLVGTDRAIVWDTLAHPAQMAPVPELAGGLPLTVVYSHADWDHVWGTCGLGDGRGAGVPGAGLEAVVAWEPTAARFREDVPADLERRRAAAAPGSLDAVRLVPPTVAFGRSLTLDLGGATLELHPLPGHTRDCIVGFVPEWGVLLAGDTVETPLPVVNDGAAVPDWTQRLDRWAADPAVTLVVPAHGRVGGRELIQETSSYLRGLLSASAPGSPDAVALDLSSALAFYAKTHARNLQRVADAVGAPKS